MKADGHAHSENTPEMSKANRRSMGSVLSHNVLQIIYGLHVCFHDPQMPFQNPQKIIRFVSVLILK